MIVKVVVREKDISIWNKEGDRLYYSDEANDVAFAKDLLEKYKTPYYNACWKNKIVAIQKPAKGYTW